MDNKNLDNCYVDTKRLITLQHNGFLIEKRADNLRLSWERDDSINEMEACDSYISSVLWQIIASDGKVWSSFSYIKGTVSLHASHVLKYF